MIEAGSNSVWFSLIPVYLLNNKISIPAYLRAQCRLIASNYAGPQPNFMFPFHEYLSGTLTQEGREKAIGPRRSQPGISVNCIFGVAFLWSKSINLNLGRPALFL